MCEYINLDGGSMREKQSNVAINLQPTWKQRLAPFPSLWCKISETFGRFGEHTFVQRQRLKFSSSEIYMCNLSYRFSWCRANRVRVILQERETTTVRTKRAFYLNVMSPFDSIRPRIYESSNIDNA